MEAIILCQRPRGLRGSGGVDGCDAASIWLHCSIFCDVPVLAAGQAQGYHPDVLAT